MLVEEVGGGSDGDDEPSKDNRNGSGKIHGLERRVNSNEQLKQLFNNLLSMFQVHKKVVQAASSQRENCCVGTEKVCHQPIHWELFGVL